MGRVAAVVNTHGLVTRHGLRGGIVLIGICHFVLGVLEGLH